MILEAFETCTQDRWKLANIFKVYIQAYQAVKSSFAARWAKVTVATSSAGLE